MSIGIGQLILILLLIIVLFGKYPNITNDILRGIKNMRELSKNSNENEEAKQIAATKSNDEKKN